MPIVGISSASRDRLGDRGRHGLEHDREAAGLLERERVLVELHGLRGRPALGLEAAEHRRRLRGQPDVAHHGHAGARERANAREHRSGALQLDRVRARLLDEADRVLERLLVRDLERAERHVGDHERPARAAVDRARQDDHLVHRRRHRRVVTEDDHRGRVADEDHVDARVVRDPARRSVVRGDHHDAVATTLHLCELRQRELAGRRGAGCGLARAGGHERSPFGSGMLSIRRTEPTRAAIARVGPSRSATST